MKNLIVENSRKISSVQVRFQFVHLLSSASVYKLLQVTATEQNESQTAAETEKVWTDWRNVTESKSFIELFTQGSFEILPPDGSKINFKTFLSIKDADVYVTVSSAIAVSVTMYKRLMHILLSQIIQQEIVHCIGFSAQLTDFFYLSSAQLMNIQPVNRSTDGMKLTTSEKSYNFVGFDYKTTIAYFSEITEDDSVSRILPMSIDTTKPSGFKKTVTGFTASLNFPYVDQQLKEFIRKTPPLSGHEIDVSVAEDILPGNFPNPSG